MTATSSHPQGRLVEVAGLRLHVHDHGDGPAVLLLHGGGPGASAWGNFHRNVPKLAERFRVLALDLPGFGGSTKLMIDGPMLAFHARVVAELLDVLAIERADVVGNSLGGQVATRLALDAPERVGRLVLMSSVGGVPLLTPQPTEAIMRLATYYQPPGPSPESLETVLRGLVHDHTALTPELLAERYAASVAPDLMALPHPGPRPTPEDFGIWKELGDLRQPVLLVWGRDDRALPLDQAIFALGQIPDGRLHVFANCGHWAQWERADEFNRLVADFLSPEHRGAS